LIVDAMSRKHRIATETAHDRIDPEALHVTSTRGGEVVGRHLLTLDSSVDRIEIVHDAKNREGFALGALHAARWLHGRSGVHDFTNIVDQLDPHA
jgi:4-hydroxy-tetrahydrodipicolinate reductase